jgi:hypothetical protein
MPGSFPTQLQAGPSFTIFVLTKPQLKFTIEVNEGTPGGKESLVFRKVPFSTIAHSFLAIE